MGSILPRWSQEWNSHWDSVNAGKISNGTRFPFRVWVWPSTSFACVGAVKPGCFSRRKRDVTDWRASQPFTKHKCWQPTHWLYTWLTHTARTSNLLESQLFTSIPRPMKAEQLFPIITSLISRFTGNSSETKGAQAAALHHLGWAGTTSDPWCPNWTSPVSLAAQTGHPQWPLVLKLDTPSAVNRNYSSLSGYW